MNMSLNPGARLGPYEILSPLGAGGMGEVYRAKDTRLDRPVAVKVLPAHFAKDADMGQRFEREARAISALTHPHICALYDVGNQEGTAYLVMELIEGESLAVRLAKGPLPVEHVLRFGGEIADALEVAHGRGIIHRDLKPGNVMLTKSGVKLLDFGLAKFQPAPLGAVSGVSRLATEAGPGDPLTQRGSVVGTFQYMAPEQLEGKEADARSDIFALGCVLFEMATGRKAFEGKSHASLIGAILRDEPPAISEVVPMSPPALNRVVKTCLAKDPADRFQTAHDIKLQLRWIAEGGSQAGLPAPVAARRKSRERLAWGVAAASLALAAILAVGYARRAPPPRRAVRFEIATPGGVSVIDAPRISPDGRTLAFDATDASGQKRIWVRPLSALAAQPLAGTEGTGRVFWSPDSRFLGFFANGKLKKIEVTGGPAQKICDAPGGSDGSWSSDGVILFDGTGADPIYRVAAGGGIPQVAVKPDAVRKEAQVGWPEFLPDGKHFLYLDSGEKAEENAYRIGSLESGETKRLAPAQTLVTYAPPGYLLFVRDKTLVAQPFDPKALMTTGEPIPLAEHIGTDSAGLARFSVSRDGILVYRTGETGDRFLWIDRSGKEGETVSDAGESRNPAFAPGGDRLAFDFADPRSGKTDIWIRDLKRNVSSRFTFSKGPAASPIWSPDGRRVVYAVAGDLFEKAVEGQGEETPFLKSEEGKSPSDWSRDGRFIAYSSLAKETGWDIWILPTSGDRKPFPFLKTTFGEFNPAFSPDGRFLAYQSDESGRVEVYVQSFPGPGGKWQVSTSGGAEPHWRADGKELFYRGLDQKVMSVDVQTGGSFAAGAPRTLFQGRFDMTPTRNRFLPTADGKRFLTVAPLGREAMIPTTVVLNWYSELGP